MYLLNDLEEGIINESPSEEFNQAVLNLIEVRNAQNKVGQILLRAHLLSLPNGINNYVRNITDNHALHLSTAQTAKDVHLNTGANILYVIFSRGKTEKLLKKLLRDYSQNEVDEIIKIKRERDLDADTVVEPQCDPILERKLATDDCLYQKLSVLNEIYFLTWSLEFMQQYYELDNIGGCDFSKLEGFSLQEIDSAGIYSAEFIDKKGISISIAELTNLQLNLEERKKASLKDVSIFLTEEFLYLSAYRQAPKGEVRLAFYNEFCKQLYVALSNVKRSKTETFWNITSEYIQSENYNGWKRHVNFYGLKIPISNSIYKLLRANDEN